MKKQRIDKFISNQLLLSRSVVRSGILKGKATVNGDVVRNAGTIIDADNDVITDEGNPIGYKEYVYILMNKPKGVLSAANDKSRETVVDLVPESLRRQGLFPVGRLDKDTTGLLLITDDGIFAHNCISPKKAISKSYIATLDGDINDDMIKQFKEGVVLADGTLCKSALLERVAKNIARIIITEGKYHQIKRMFGTVGLGVNDLHREAIGGLALPDTLKEGECIEMTKEQLENSILYR
ncbi:MAG: rRNA pseudouridine synthase [Clostridia bacterium]|nr:rRNA pseudouridine synthase [Clostridia bacterium]